MSAGSFNFTTGPAPLPDVGTLSYNGCVFSPLFVTNVSGQAVKDESNRTVKYVEYKIKADGYVTLPFGATSTSGTMATLRNLLTAQGGSLTYRGKGMDLLINGGGEQAEANFNAQTDVAWGPAPELLEFQPLGGGLSAKVAWQVTVRVYEQAKRALSLKRPGRGGAGGGGGNGGAGNLVPINIPGKGGAGGGQAEWDWAGGGKKNAAAGGAAGGLASVFVLQFNYETVLTYGEDGYSSMSCQGTVEIPMTRSPNQATRTLTQTVDDVRGLIEDRVMSGVDLARFRVTRRTFSYSRDKRTLNWDFQVEEKPPMDNPQGHAVARGTYSVRPANAGMGLVLWLCTLRITYTTRKDWPRRMAWEWFLAYLRLRMYSSTRGVIPTKDKQAQQPQKVEALILDKILGKKPDGDDVQEVLKQQKGFLKNVGNKSFLIDFNIEEGMHQDSKSITFSATWRLVTGFSHILLASGIWRKLPESDAQKNNLWAVSMADIQGAYSWVGNVLNTHVDAIVDFGGD